MVSQGGACLVVDFKASVKLESIQQLLEEVAFGIASNQCGERTAELEGRQSSCAQQLALALSQEVIIITRKWEESIRVLKNLRVGS